MCRTKLLRALLVIALSLGGLQSAVAHEMNLAKSGVALQGYDPVSYHREGMAKKGSKGYEIKYGEGTFRFSSAENRAEFLDSPEKYLPAFGGYCAYGVAMGKKFDGDPLVWQLVEGRLYLALDHGTQRIWLSALEKNVAMAKRIWPAIKRVPSAQLDN